MSSAIGPFSAQFKSKRTERAYQAFIFEGDARSNFHVMLVSFFFYSIYVVLDMTTLTEWREVALIRFAAVAVSATLLFLVQTEKFKRHQELAIFAITIILAIDLNIIIFFYTELEHAYYVGLVQECVFVCFLLRMNFLRTITSLLSIVVMFAPVVMLKPDGAEHGVQIVVMTTMAGVCAVGSYMLQKIRRYDFQKTEIIEQQNEQLKILLDDVRRDNTRKIAAINTLVHFVKTPLHQINGFSDILVRSLASDDETVSEQERTDSAKYIKDATASLSNSVNKLLTYHRLDEIERQHDLETVSIDDGLSDFSDMLDAEISTKINADAGDIKTIPVALRTTFESLAAFFNGPARNVSQVTIDARPGDSKDVLISIQDNGAALSAEEFAEDTKPLTKIENYLSGAGAEMPMTLRTVARAVELMGGEFSHEPMPGGNKFTLHISEYAKPTIDLHAVA